MVLRNARASGDLRLAGRLTSTSRPARLSATTLAARGDELIDEAARRSRASLRARGARLIANALPIAQTSLGAALAWVVAHDVIGHQRPFFAPIAATISLGVTLGARGRRTIEMVVGVSVGVLVGDLLTAAIGHGTWQIALFVALAMAAALALGGGPLLVGQAASSAVLVASLAPPTNGVDLSRSLDALIGGTIGLGIHYLLPVDVVGRARRATAPLIAELAGALEDVADALEARDLDRAEAALERARHADALAARLHDAVSVGVETARLAPPRRGARGQLALYAGAAHHLELAVRNVRVLARGAVRALVLEDNVPPDVPLAVRELAAAVRALGRELETGDGAEEVRDAAVRAAGHATQVLEGTSNLSVSVLVGQVRSTAVDLLRALGLEHDDARRVVVDAARSLEED
ncbi:MAG: aromatic acid exporter family protein [Actinobacteria bacterium]|nr:MAG: aromatic acid exporter family protein [Actinomycetota bacterium]